MELVRRLKGARLRPCLLVCNEAESGGIVAHWRINREPDWWAKAGVIVLLIVLVRTAAEYYRLRHLYGSADALLRYEPYIGGLLTGALFCLVALVLLLWRRPLASVITSAIAVIVLLVYKAVMIG